MPRALRGMNTLGRRRPRKGGFAFRTLGGAHLVVVLRQGIVAWLNWALIRLVPGLGARIRGRGPGMNVLQRFLFESRGGMFQEFEGLTAHFKPKDVELYRHLLPAQFGMPRRPIVTIFVADYKR